MPLSSHLVGRSTEPIVHDVDARWIMAYAAGLGDALPCYIDTRRPHGVVGHPLFPVCFEWPVVLAGRQLAGDDVLTLAEAMRGVHATHDLIIHRLVRAGERLTTRLTIVGVERRKPGAYQRTRLDTTDTAGTPVCTTWMGALYRDVEVIGPDRPATDAPLPPEAVASPSSCAEHRIPIAATAAHVYSECARIWNPIHTDAAFAAAAGLPALILHGTATLALAVSRVIADAARAEPARVRRVAGRFGAMVFMPSEITVRILARQSGGDGDIVRFEVQTAEGGLAVRDGLVALR